MLIKKFEKCMIDQMHKFNKFINNSTSLPHAQSTAELLLELGIIVVFLKAYNVTRNLFGSQACSPQLARPVGIHGALGQLVQVDRSIHGRGCRFFG